MSGKGFGLGWAYPQPDPFLRAGSVGGGLGIGAGTLGQDKTLVP